MPELPEVETVMSGLASVMHGAVIAHVQVNRPDLRWPIPLQMGVRLTGQRVLALRRRAKYILLDLGSGETLLIHLGMSGRILISGDALGRFVHLHPTPQKHDHVVFDMADGTRITFNDPRRFGAMDLLPTNACETTTLLANIGPEPLGNKFNETYLISQLAGRKMPMKSALLDQKIVAGLGNIYVCEVLYRAGISPLRKASNLSQRRVASLVPVIRDVLLEAIKAGGSTLRDFRQVDGALGLFNHKFAVYGKEGAPCPTKDCNGTIKRVVQSGRSSFYCQQCQR